MKHFVADELSQGKVEEQLSSWEKNVWCGCCFFFVVGCRQRRMKMWFRNQMQTTSALLGGLRRKCVCAGDIADHWPHPTHHPLGIFRVHKQTNGKRLVSFFLFLNEGQFIVNSSSKLLQLASWVYIWIWGFIWAGRGWKRFHRQRMGSLFWAFASSSWGFKLFVDLNLRFSCPMEGDLSSLFSLHPQHFEYSSIKLWKYCTE